MNLLRDRLTSHRIFASVVVHLNISHLICNRVPLPISPFASHPCLSETGLSCMYHVKGNMGRGTYAGTG